MHIHLFGAFFGLAVSFMLYKSDHRRNPNEVSDATSDLFAMIGTLFLWIYWPSFNGALAQTADAQYRAMINTYLAMVASTLLTFACSAIFNEEAKFNIVKKN